MQMSKDAQSARLTSAPGSRAGSIEMPPWCMFALGGVITFFFVYIGIARPAAREMEAMRAQIGSMERTVAKIAGQSRTIAKTNGILAQLVAQSEQAIAAAGALDEMQHLHDRIVNESTSLRTAKDAVNQLAAIKDDVIYEARNVQSAKATLDEIHTLHDEVIGTVEQIGAARMACNDMASLEDELILQGNDVSQARDSLDALVSLRYDLENETLDLSETQERVDELVRLQETVLSQTGKLADAIETLELASDLQIQFQEASSTFGRIRTWLVEVVTMESLIKRAMHTLEPITALGNLNRVDDIQLRNAARAVIQKNQVRVAERPVYEMSDSSTAAETAVDGMDWNFFDEVELD